MNTGFTLYLIRHGQSEANAGLTTSLDSHLTDLGWRQAQAAAESLSSTLTSARAVVLLSSPFRRTMQTASALVRAAGRGIRPFPPLCEYIAEQDERYRSFRGINDVWLHTEYGDVLHPESEALPYPWWNEKLETIATLRKRCENMLNILCETYKSNESVVAYSHAEPIGRTLEAVLNTPSIDSVRPPWPANCSVSQVTWDGVSWTVDRLVDASHLVERGIDVTD